MNRRTFISHAATAAAISTLPRSFGASDSTAPAERLLARPFDRALENRDAVADLLHHFDAPGGKLFARKIFGEGTLMDLRTGRGTHQPDNRNENERPCESRTY